MLPSAIGKRRTLFKKLFVMHADRLRGGGETQLFCARTEESFTGGIVHGPGRSRALLPSRAAFDFKGQRFVLNLWAPIDSL